MPNKFEFNAKIWLYPGKAAWHFITLPQNEAKLINGLFSNMKRGWGSLPVKVKTGNTEWETSIFPDKKSDSYLLPIKSDVRKKEKINIDDEITVKLEIKI